MGLEKLIKIIIATILFIALLFLPAVKNFLRATYMMIQQFNSGFIAQMPSWFGWMVAGFIIAALIILVKSHD